jgi:integrase/recombinase XerD
MRTRGYSEGTVSKRRNHLNDFIVWAEDRSLTRPGDIARPVLERYQRHLSHRIGRNDKPLTFGNQHSRLTSLRAWFKWLARQRVILHNPASEIELPRIGHRLPKHVLSESDVETVMSIPDIAKPKGIRDRAILETFYSTGIRRFELVGLRVDAIDNERGVLTVRQGKGKKDRVVPIGDRALAWLEKYRISVRPTYCIDPNEPALFLTRMGEPFSESAMSALVHTYIARANTGKTGSCHLFRHSMATLMHENGCDVRHIQAILGHVKLETTQIYTQVSIRKLKQVHSATHPAAQPRKEREG